MITEILSRLFLKLKIFTHKLFNWSIYKKGVILYGIPRMIYRNRITIEKNVKINEGVFLHGAGEIEIKENSTLSYGTVIVSTQYDITGWANQTHETKPTHLEQKVTIGEHVWIGANATILPGVTIADNCVIAAGTLVNKSLVEPNTLYAGVPAKPIKKLL